MAGVRIADVTGDVFGLVVADHRVEALVDVRIPLRRLVRRGVVETEGRRGEHAARSIAEVLRTLVDQRVEMLGSYHVDQHLAHVGVA